MKNIKFLSMVAICLMCLAATQAYSQKVWEKSEQKWSKEDASKILNNSPWAQFFVPSSAYYQQNCYSDFGSDAESSGGSKPWTARFAYQRETDFRRSSSSRLYLAFTAFCDASRLESNRQKICETIWNTFAKWIRRRGNRGRRAACRTRHQRN